MMLSDCCRSFLYLIFAVHCRTGSLEKVMTVFTTTKIVHCRTGSLEIREYHGDRPCAVHCRTGSLEMMNLQG